MGCPRFGYSRCPGFALSSRVRRVDVTRQRRLRAVRRAMERFWRTRGARSRTCRVAAESTTVSDRVALLLLIFAVVQTPRHQGRLTSREEASRFTLQLREFASLV